MDKKNPYRIFYIIEVWLVLQLSPKAMEYRGFREGDRKIPIIAMVK